MSSRDSHTRWRAQPPLAAIAVATITIHFLPLPDPLKRIILGISFASCIAFRFFPFLSKPGRSRIHSTSSPSSLPSCILPCITSHRRLLPVLATHAFEYPLIYIGVDLDDLQSGALDLSSRYFNYNSSPLTTVLGIKSSSYILADSPAFNPKETAKSFKDQLLDLVAEHGVSRTEVGRVWMITMPSYLGFTGINPLTVYLCYTSEDQAQRYEKSAEVEAKEGAGAETPESEEWVKVTDSEEERKGITKTETPPPKNGRRLLCVVLEVHNTFGERHAYVLRSDQNQCPPLAGHDKSWIFPRSFHVSPFNDRSGFYRLDILDPFPPSSTSGPIDKPRPFKITLNQLTSDKRFKLYAVLKNHPDKQVLPITTGNIFRSILVKQPFDLLMTTPRILYQAYLLHYAKRLLVYPRPEPESGAELDPGMKGMEKPWNSAGKDDYGVGKGIGWQSVGFGERWAEKVISRCLEEVCLRRGITTIINFSNPARTTLKFGKPQEATTDLEIWTRHPNFFTELLLAWNPDLFILSAQTDKHSKISSPEIFRDLFTSSDPSRQASRLTTSLQAIRLRHFLFLASFATSAIPPGLVVSHGPHFLDSTLSQNWTSALLMLLVASVQHGADRAEEWIMFKLGAKFVTGREPWGTTARVVDHLWGRSIGEAEEDQAARTYGSIMVDNGDDVVDKS